MFPFSTETFIILFTLKAHFLDGKGKKELIAKVVSKIGTFVQSEAEGEKEGWKLFITDEVPKNIKERRDNEKNDTDGEQQ